MSRNKLQARDKLALKMTKDGLVERNVSTGANTRISSREVSHDLRGSAIDRQDSQNFSENPAGGDTGRKQTFRQNNIEKQAEQNADPTQNADNMPQTTRHDTHASSEQNTAQYNDTPIKTRKYDQFDRLPTDINPAIRHQSLASQIRHTDEPESVLRIDKDDNIRHTRDDTSPDRPDSGKRRQARPDFYDKTANADDTSGTATKPEKNKQHKSASDTAGSNELKKPGKLQFNLEDVAPAKPQVKPIDPKLVKAERKMDRAMRKLDKAHMNLPVKHKLRSTTALDGKSGEIKRKLQFEKMPLTKGENIKGALPLRPVRTAANVVAVAAHRNAFQHGDDNVSVIAAHRTAMYGEAGARTALRFKKTAPYRKVAKLEKAARKKSVNLAYRRSLAENPKLRSNVFSRMMQKRKIKLQYAKTARKAKKTALKAKKAGSVISRAGKAIASLIKKNPKVILIIALLALVIIIIGSCVSTVSSFVSSNVTTIVASTYLADDADILGAAAVYAEMEDELQYLLDNYEYYNPGFDEYRFYLDRIWHDPYVLISIISAMHEGEWTLGEVMGTLIMLFERQYTLTETVTVEVRTRIETTIVIDEETGEETEVTEEVEYNYYIITVILENYILSRLPIFIMSEQRVGRYALYMMTLGNRPDLFPVSQFPNASTMREPLRYDIPPQHLEDAVFAAMMEEALKYVGWPYVWGGSSPVTSFDCSGFVSWVLNQSGWNIGRLGANGLYNRSTPISPSQARPGDLVFFQGTFRSDSTITHVGIYVGDGMFIHAGNPIGFASLNTTYYQNHFYGFARP
jgi:hypothetical protein